MLFSSSISIQNFRLLEDGYKTGPLQSIRQEQHLFSVPQSSQKPVCNENIMIINVSINELTCKGT